MRKLLCWSDSPAAPTGFGTVAKHVLKALESHYEIDVLGINHPASFSHSFPYHIMPARLLDPKDPYGQKMFARALSQKEYDVVWVMNDTFLTAPIASRRSGAISLIEQVRESARPPLFVYYYPVDCKVVPEYSSFITAADVPVAYSHFGKEATLAALPEMAERDLPVIYHGADTEVFSPLAGEERRSFRRRCFNADDKTFVIVNINRNGKRKQLPQTLLAFSEFHKIVSNSKLYLHTDLKDPLGDSDLLLVARELGLEVGKDVLFPKPGFVSQGIPEKTLAVYLGCADASLTTTLGEGFGLLNCHSMSCGITAIAPSNTTHDELLADGRGVLYPCKDLVWRDNQGFRKAGRIEDIVDAMMRAYAQKPRETEERKKKCLQWSEEHSWSRIGEQWVELLERRLESHAKTNSGTSLGVLV